MVGPAVPLASTRTGYESLRTFRRLPQAEALFERTTTMTIAATESSKVRTNGTATAMIARVLVARGRLSRRRRRRRTSQPRPQRCRQVG